MFRLLWKPEYFAKRAFIGGDAKHGVGAIFRQDKVACVAFRGVTVGESATAEIIPLNGRIQERSKVISAFNKVGGPLIPQGASGA